jgi:hypothetical protein
MYGVRFLKTLWQQEERMGKTKALIKKAYSEHFNGLKEIAEQIDELKKISLSVHEPAAKEALRKHIEVLDKGLRGYAQNLETRGLELFENVA